MTEQIRQIVLRQLEILEDAVKRLDSSELTTMSYGLAATLDELPIDFLCRASDDED